MEKFYTVEDIAKMTMFTTRTIRNYLKDGLLTGRKIGGQWRFTSDDIEKFMNQGQIGDMIRSEKKQNVLDFLDGIFSEYTGEVQTCTITDVYRPKQAVQELADKLVALPSAMASPNAPALNRMSYEYDNSESRARFILFGTPEYIGEAMKIVSHYKGD